MKIKKGDNVIILSGKDKGKKGKILTVLSKTSKVIVEGINKLKRHTKNRQGKLGGIVEKEHPIYVSKCMLLDPETGKPTRLGYTIDKSGAKYRISRQTKKIIEVKIEKKK